MFRIRLKELREENGYTSQAAFAKAFGVAQSTVGGWESGAREPNFETMIKLANFFHVTVDYLVGNVNDPSFYLDNERILREINSYDDESTTKWQEYAATPAEMEIIKKYRSLDDHGKDTTRYIIERELLRTKQLQTAERMSAEKPDNIIYLKHAVQKASAGTGFLLGEGYMDSWAVVFNELTRRADFCVDVDGRSMEPLYHDGDTVLIREQPSVELGQIGLYIKDGKGYIKRQGDGKVESVNPEYGDVEPEEFIDIRCIGRVIGVLDSEWVR